MNTSRISIPLSRPRPGCVALVLLLITGFCAAPARAQVTNILVKDTFSGAAGPLNNRTPDTDGGSTWIAASDWSTTGTSATCTGGDSSAFYPFVPVQGSVYTLSANLDDPSGGSAWGALGFCGNQNTGYGNFADPGSGIGSVGWALIEPDGSPDTIQFFFGPYTDQGPGQVGGSFYPAGPANYAIILDATPASPANWTFSLLINGVVAVPATAFGGSGPSINYVGLTSWDPFVMQNFTLTQVIPPVPAAPFIVTPPVGATNYVGESDTLSVVAGGYPVPTYQWQQNSNNLSGATGSSLALSSLALTNTGYYQIVLSNSVNCITSAPVRLLVQVPITNVIYEDLFSGAAGPLNGRTPDTVDAPAAKWIATFDWGTDGFGDALAAPNPGVNSGTTAAYLSFNPLPESVYILSATLDDPNIGSGGWVGMGYAGAESTGYANFADSGSGIGTVGWALIGPDDEVAYTDQFFVGPYTDNGGPVGGGFYPTGPNTYAVVLDTRPAAANWTFTFMVGGVVAKSATAFGGGGPTINYVTLGGFDPEVVQNFTLTQITAANAPFIVTPPVGETNYVGGSDTLSVVAGGYPVPTYQWQQNSASLPGATASSLLLSPLSVTNSGSYQVVISNAGGSITSAPVTLMVDVPQTNIIYEDLFSGAAGALNGRTPDTVDVPAAQWIAGSDWQTTGTSATSSSPPTEAYLPFVPVQGVVYTLSGNLDDSNVGSSGWVVLGFAGGANQGNFAGGSGIGGVGWQLVAPDGSEASPLQSFIGPDTGGQSFENGFYPNGPTNYAIVLDATPASPANWTFTFLIGGVVARPATAFGGSGPAINYVALGGWDPEVVQNFLLTEEVAAPSPTITISMSGGQTTVTWSAGVLQTAGTVSGPWSTVNGATSPYTVSANGHPQFFRAQQ